MNSHNNITEEIKKPKAVAIFGAGIAGLTVAHEFSRRGYNVFIYEANEDAGGFFRSARMPKDDNMPSQYSWHGMGPWYHNVFDLLKQIPFDETGNMYDKALSRPINFGLAPDIGNAAFDDTWLVNVKNMFKMTWLDVIWWGWLMLKTWTAHRRTLETYSRQNAAEQWQPLLTERAWNIWKSSFGPWIGSDWTNVSLHTAGQFFHKLLITKPSHLHPADDEGPAWVQGPRSGWLLLRGPSNEYWFDRWVAFLQKTGVAFFWKESLQRFDFDGKRITAAYLSSGIKVEADVYVLATNPFAAADILERTPALAAQEQLCLFKPLIQDGPHTQVSLRFAFTEKIMWPRKRAAVVVANSEFDLTIFAQEQAWAPDVDLGDDIKSLWTITACVGTVPGRLYGLPVVRCTKEQFIEEVKAQIFRCEGFDAFIKKANHGRGVQDFPMQRIEVWHEWLFSHDGIKTHQPKWVNTTNNQPYLPTQVTPVPNLLLAGAHTKTAADVWSIEAAVESGRRAVQVIEPDVRIIPQYKPLLFRIIGAMDDILFTIGFPHILNFLAIGILITLIMLVAFFVS